ncbi:outer membrane lipoprotein-sorting protein [Maribellus comscasis]|uniref:Outer membrane lipoprotein-sorting protein n=1 Tax=Maribellus comscasis TaxID=2681766 RepID=A0A6I6JWU8_9BACT|nr:outer membrane lipoprotein-sorting protein [Maribellus comscasis]QGY47585.1 outer membrane lipoprotein-sorting protein [Maribellus comscasis]
METLKFYTLLFCLVVVTTNIQAQTLNGREIIQKVKDRPDGDTRSSEMTMQLINKRGSIRERKVISYSMDFGRNMKDRKTLMFFRYPGDVKGTGFLTWDYDEIGKDDDKWLYLPAMKKTRRISGSSAKKDYFMGTDFTYDDMGSRNVDEDDHKLLQEENLDGYICWVVESTSKDSRDIYSKKVSWIRKDCLIAMKVEYYDKNKKLHRELKMSDIEKADGFWLAKKMDMKNVQTNHQTIILIEDPKYNIPIDENSFTVVNLEKGSI